MRRIGLIAAILILSGCATDYQRQGPTFLGWWDGYGYSSTQIDTNVFQVTFKGNAYTESDRANNFALLRSAELTLENGYEYFVIIDAQKYSKNSSDTTPTTSTTNIRTNTIMCFKEKPEEFSYNARFIEKSLKKKYQRNKSNE
jgi:hypothetical protein